MAKLHLEPVLGVGLNSLLATVGIPSDFNIVKGLVKSESEDSQSTEATIYKVSILLNVGWDLDFSSDALEAYSKLGNIDIILITDAEFEYLGALPWLLKNINDAQRALPLILCTEACYKYARAMLVDVLENVAFSTDFSHYTHEDLDLLFRSVTKVRYKETVCFTRHLANADDVCRLAIAAVNNGNTIGGALFKVSVGNDVLLLGKEAKLVSKWYLNPFDIQGIGKTATPAIAVQSGSRNFCSEDETPPFETCANMEEVVHVIYTTLRRNGSILIPVDVGCGMIDLLVHLDAAWSNCELSFYNLVLVSPIADKLLLLFGTCIEYMRSNVCLEFFKSLQNPMLNLKNIRFCTRLNQLQRYQYAPTVYISTTSCIKYGFSSFIFAGLASGSANSVILTSYSASAREILTARHGVDFCLSINMQHKEMEPLAAPQPLVNQQLPSKQPRVDLLSTNATTTPAPTSDFTRVGNEIVFAVQENHVVMEYNDHVENYGLPHELDVTDVDFNPMLLPLEPQQPESPQDSVEPNASSNTRIDYNHRNIFEEYYRRYSGSSKAREAAEEGCKGLVRNALVLDIKCQVYAIDLSKVTHDSIDYGFEYNFNAFMRYLEPRIFVCNDASKILPFAGCNVHSLDTQVGNGKGLTLDLNAEMVPISFENAKCGDTLARLSFASLISNSRHLHHGVEDYSMRDKGASSNRIFSTLRQCREIKNRIGHDTIQLVGTFVPFLRHNDNDGNEAVVAAGSRGRRLESITFWSDAPPEASFSFDIDSGDGEIQHVNESTLYCGRVGVDEILKCLIRMLPHSTRVDGGRLHCFSSLLKRVGDSWRLEGTLCPSFYLLRKLLAEIHHRVEPVYGRATA